MCLSSPPVPFGLSKFGALTFGDNPSLCGYISGLMTLILLPKTPQFRKYKAVLPDGSALTVKRLHHCILPEQQFRAEMDRIHRPNLASLIGFCIAIGAARGLSWLHHAFHVPFLHQDFGSSALLLDEEHEPEITDFGLAGLNMSQPVHFSTKDDVYELGIVLLEPATDRSKGFTEDLANWRIWFSVTGQTHEAIDESLRGKGNDGEIVEFLKIACDRVAAQPEERRSMYEVYKSLKKSMK